MWSVLIKGVSTLCQTEQLLKTATDRKQMNWFSGETGGTCSLQPTSTNSFPLTGFPRAGGWRSFLPHCRGRGHWEAESLRIGRKDQFRKRRQDGGIFKPTFIRVKVVCFFKLIMKKPPGADSSKRCFLDLWWELTSSAWCRGFSSTDIPLKAFWCTPKGRKAKTNNMNKKTDTLWKTIKIHLHEKHTFCITFN